MRILQILLRLALLLAIAVELRAQQALVSFSPQDQVSKRVWSWQCMICNANPRPIHVSSGFVYLGAQTKIKTVSVAEARRQVANDLKHNRWTQAAQLVSFAADLGTVFGAGQVISMSAQKLVAVVAVGQGARKVAGFLQAEAPVNPIDAFGDALLQGGYDIAANDCVMDRILFSRKVRNADTFQVLIGSPVPPEAPAPPAAAVTPKPEQKAKP